MNGTEKHTIFAANPWMLRGKESTALKTQSSFIKPDLGTLYFPKKMSNNWFDPKLLAKKSKGEDKLGESLRQTKKQIIKQIEKGLPDMKAQLQMNAISSKIFNETTFRKSLSLKKISRKQQSNQEKIRKISVLSINSTKSLQQNSDSPQLQGKNHIDNHHKRTHRGNLIMPVTMSRQDLENSHYNNQKYDNRRFHTDNGPDNDYEQQIKSLKNQLKKSEIVINTLKIRELEGEVQRLKEKDKKYDEIISSLMETKSRQKQISQQQERQRSRQKQKQKQKQRQRYKQRLAAEKQKKSKDESIIRKKDQQKRSKTQMKQQPSSSLKNKQIKTPLNYHVLADHLKQIQTQKQFNLLNPSTTRQKLHISYHQLRKLPIPQITINPFRIPKIPNAPRHEYTLDNYLNLAKQLCRCLGYQIGEIDIVIRKYRNCVSFRLMEGDQMVIWGFDGKLYIGKWVQFADGEGKKQGSGMQFSNNYCFRGQFKDNKKCGKGIAQFYNGNVYEGQWQNGKMQGKGIYFDKSTSIYYQGQWSKGEMKGRGVIKYNKKHFYTGEICNFGSSGKGTQFYQNGDIYEGGFEKGRPNGYGIMYYASEEYYVGNYKNGLKHGTGLHLTNKFSPKNDKDKQQESYYYGQFYQGVRSGYGIQRTMDSNYYLGYFYNGVPHGPGILQNSPILEKDRDKGNIIKMSGTWKNGKLIVRNKNIQGSQKSQSQQFSQLL